MWGSDGRPPCQRKATSLVHDLHFPTARITGLLKSKRKTLQTGQSHWTLRLHSAIAGSLGLLRSEITMMSIFIYSSFQTFIYPPISKREAWPPGEECRISVVSITWTSIRRLSTDSTIDLICDFRGSRKSLMLPNLFPSCFGVHQKLCYCRLMALH